MKLEYPKYIAYGGSERVLSTGNKSDAMNEARHWSTIKGNGHVVLFESPNDQGKLILQYENGTRI